MEFLLLFPKSAFPAQVKKLASLLDPLPLYVTFQYPILKQSPSILYSKYFQNFVVFNISLASSQVSTTLISLLK